MKTQREPFPALAGGSRRLESAHTALPRDPSPPNALDRTFGPDVKFTGTTPGMKGNRPPSDGLQFFGTMRIDARTRAMRVGLHDLSGRTLYSVELAAA